MNDNDMERYLNEVCRGVGGSRSLRRHLREELQEHLMEATEFHMTEGHSEEEAVRQAIEEFGKAEQVSADLQGIYGRRTVALLIEKAMDWKEKTMKSRLIWKTVTHVAIGLTIAMGIGFVLATLIFILPKLEHFYHDHGMSLPSFCASFWNLIIGITFYWYTWVPVLVLVWIVFEIRSKSEHKSTIRLALGGLGSLLTMAIVFLTAATILVSFSMIVPSIPLEQLDRHLFQLTEEASQAYIELEKALEENNWIAADRANDDFHGSLGDLRRFGRSVPVVAMYARNPEEEEQLKKLLEEIVDNSRRLDFGRALKKRAPQMQDVERLRESYQRLENTLVDWPGGTQSNEGNSR